MAKPNYIVRYSARALAKIGARDRMIKSPTAAPVEKGADLPPSAPPEVIAKATGRKKKRKDEDEMDAPEE